MTNQQIGLKVWDLSPWLKIGLLISLCLGFVLAPITHAQNPTPDIAWIHQGELWLAGRDIDPFKLPLENITYALFSPQGTRLAVVQNEATLIILEMTNPSDTNTMIAADNFPADTVLGYFAWQGEEVLWFNTLQHRRNPNNPGDSLLQTDWALWIVRDGKLSSTSDQGRGGVAYPSPNGQFIAWVYPGRYGETPGVISIYSAAGDKLGEYSYPAVSSGSHLDWLPDVHWVGDHLQIALPDPDLVYTIEPPYPPTRLIELSSTGEEQVLGELQLAFPLELVWSPDGTQLAYLASGGNFFVRDLASQTELMYENDLPLGTDLIEWGAQHLILNALEQGIIFWAEGSLSTMQNVWGIAHTSAGGYVTLEGSPTGMIQLWTNAIPPTPHDPNAPDLHPIPMPMLEKVIAEGLTTFEVQLVGGIR